MWAALKITQVLAASLAKRDSEEFEMNKRKQNTKFFIDK
jgi:hypothetical protein